MNLLQNIEIKNFRGFDSFKTENFSQINLLIGKNNSGKSSLLEAIFMLIGMSNPILPDNVNRLRGLNIKTADEFKFLFHKLKLDNIPNFECSFTDSSIRSLKLLPLFKMNKKDSSIQKLNSEGIVIEDSTAFPKMTGLELDFSFTKKQKSKKSFKSTLIVNSSEIIPNSDNNYKEDLHAVYITGINNESKILTRYSEIVKRKKGDIVLTALKKIDPNIESINPLPDGLFFSYKDIDELVPSNIAGDGVRKYLNIVTTIAERQNSIVLIDEIENGLHYSAHKSLWESIINISNEFNVQLFITSHNLETLKCLKELLETSEYKSQQDKLSLFTLTHTKKSGIKTYKYSFKGFKDAIETGTEIRL